MKRSNWKGPFININNLEKIKLIKKKHDKKVVMSRNSEITPNFVGLNFNVYNGKTFLNVSVTDKMIGHKFGEFSFTRAKFIFKKKTKKK